MPEPLSQTHPCRKSAGLSLVLALAALVLARLPVTAALGTNTTLFRFGVSARLLKGVNEADARAAVKVYAEALVRESVFPKITPVLFDSAVDLRQVLEKGAVEGLSLTLEDYLAVRERVGSVHVFNPPGQNPPGEEYVILVHQGDSARHVRDLGGAPLIVFDNSRTVAAERWLDVVLWQDGQPRAGDFFKPLTLETKLSSVILPVFFRKVRACLTTREGWDAMKELNPQVGRNLRSIAQSPPYISVVMCFGRHVDPSLKEKLLEGICHMHERPSGQQILAIFQAGKQLAEYPESCLQPTLELIATHQRLSEQRAGAAAPPKP